jgi:tetratricopeptide (TPR) repeat protein
MVGLIAAALIGTASLAVAGDRLAEALRLYDDAMYTRALEVLDALAVEQPSAAVQQYRALCFIALGRSDAAERAMSDIVAADPFFVLDDEAASPRVAAQFAAVRRRLLPPIIRRGFADATARYREGAMARARAQFDQVLKLLDDPALQNDQALSDLALVASAFVELTRVQTPPPAIAPVTIRIDDQTAADLPNRALDRGRDAAAVASGSVRGRRAHARDGQRAGGVRAGGGGGAAVAEVDAAGCAYGHAEVHRRDCGGGGCARPRGGGGHQADDSSGLRPGRARGR